VAKTQIQLYYERFGDQMVRFSSFAVKKTGLQQNQTNLQLGDYTLACSPFQISMTRAAMLVVLSPEEATFFQRYKAKLGRLSFSFLRPGSKVPISFFVRATLERISPVKGRPNIRMAELSFKICPDDLTAILGDYITSYAVLKTRFATFKNQHVDISEETLPLLGMDAEVDAQVGPLRFKAAVLTLAVNHTLLRVPGRLPNLTQGMKFAVRFSFTLHRFPAVLTVTNVGVEGNGHRRVACDMDFLPELVEVLDSYYHRKRI
jgi:hypothetical protein